MPVATTFPGLTLLVGPEDVLIDMAIADIMAKVRQQHPGALKTEIAIGGDVDSGALAQALAPTLFGDVGVVVITAGEALDEAGVQMLTLAAAEVDPVNICVVVHAGAAKGKKVLTGLRALSPPEISCAAMRKGRDTMSFMGSVMRRHDRRASTEALQVLYDAIGHDPRALAAAISQLCADVEVDPINEDAVRQYFAGVAGVAGYQVADAVWERRVSDALGDVRWLSAVSGKASVGPAVTAAMASGLRVVVGVHGMPQGMSNDAVAQQVGMPAWKVRTAQAQARKWLPERLAAATVALAGLDVAMKGGLRGKSADPEQKAYALEKFVITTVGGGK